MTHMALPIRVSALAAMPSLQQGFGIAGGGHHMQDEHVVALDAVDDEVPADGKTPQAGAQVVVTRAAHVWMAGEQKETLSNGIDQSVGNVLAHCRSLVNCSHAVNKVALYAARRNSHGH
jgi:hypothetical protein